MKALLAIYNFGLNGMLLSLGALLLYELLTSLRKQRSSASHVLFNIARQRGPLGSETSTGPCLTVSNHESDIFIIMRDTLISLNLSHMDFLDDPAAIH